MSNWRNKIYNKKLRAEATIDGKIIAEEAEKVKKKVFLFRSVFCSFCGQKSGKKDEFCSECGRKF